jgi:type II secretory pathway pseudopilin PulG
MKRAFTLIEVNLAIMVMAVGVLGIISLYALGYREERQSREDVASASYADAVMGPLVTALTATNVKWSAFKDIKSSPGGSGWAHYLESEQTGKVRSDLDSQARTAYRQTIQQLGISGFGTDIPVSDSNGGNLKPALVIMHEKDSAVVRISFRATEKENLLFAAPLYYTEARFQGVVE